MLNVVSGESSNCSPASTLSVCEFSGSRVRSTPRNTAPSGSPREAAGTEDHRRARRHKASGRRAQRSLVYRRSDVDFEFIRSFVATHPPMRWRDTAEIGIDFEIVSELIERSLVNFL